MIKVPIIILLTVGSMALGDGEESIELNENGCPVDTQIFKILSHEKCNKFYICSNGAKYDMVCPTGLFFNINENVCDWPNHVDCESRLVTTPSPPTETTPPTGSPEGWADAAAVICAREGSEGLLVEHEYCSHLYMCARGTPVEISCPEPLFFNSKSQLCDWENEVDCGSRLKGKPTEVNEYQKK